MQDYSSTTQVRETLPRFYKPWPHQVGAWNRRKSGKYTYYFKLWARQLGKDTDDIQYDLYQAWHNPGTQSCYVGLDNVWIRNNIFNKYIDGRKHWNDYPAKFIKVVDTKRQVMMLNNPPDVAEALIQFIGFLNDEALIGSAYDRFTISETSLYKDSAFQYIRPIWDRKLAMGLPLQVCFNGTPRGQANVYYDLLRIYTGVDDPADFPGDHGDCYVDKVTIREAMKPDPDNPGQYIRLYSDEEIEKLQDNYLRQFGNLNFYRQENECDFTTVNSGLVYQGIEQLKREKRYCKFSLDTSKPVYMAFDIASKGSTTDSTAAVIFQYINHQMFIFDCYEERGKALVECIADLSARDYFHLIRIGALPWDSERTASSATPIEEARQQYPSIYWHSLEKTEVHRGITQVRRMLPNMLINSDKCEWLMDCFEHYEFKPLRAEDGYSAMPRHDRYSHMMDAIRYAVMGINEIDYLKINSDGSFNDKASTYGGFYDDPAPRPNTFRKVEKPKDDGLYY